ncbi:hypothetical protein J1614_004105 [Plenodomus biglobosus]|nr:hypothetical protein J1614_004105 [Plenodomus biglobosus]
MCRFDSPQPVIGREGVLCKFLDGEHHPFQVFTLKYRSLGKYHHAHDDQIHPFTHHSRPQIPLHHPALTQSHSSRRSSRGRSITGRDAHPAQTIQSALPTRSASTSRLQLLTRSQERETQALSLKRERQELEQGDGNDTVEVVHERRSKRQRRSAAKDEVIVLD